MIAIGLAIYFYICGYLVTLWALESECPEIPKVRRYFVSLLWPLIVPVAFIQIIAQETLYLLLLLPALMMAILAYVWIGSV